MIEHECPVCGKKELYNEKIPFYICHDCLERKRKQEALEDGQREYFIDL